MKITIAESNHNIGLVTQQTLCHSLDVLARDTNMPTVTMSIASNRGQNVPMTHVNSNTYISLYTLIYWTNLFIVYLGEGWEYMPGCVCVRILHQ